MSITATFDMSEVENALRDYMAHSKRAPAVILQKQMTQLVIGAKGVKGLFQEAVFLRPKTIREIRNLPTRLGWRIKRDYGSAKAEIRRRQINAGYYQASGWITEGLPKPRGGGTAIKTQRGRVSWSGRGMNARVTIENRSPRAFEYGARTGYIQRAVNARAKDMRHYVEKKLASDAKKLSGRKPRFTTIDELLRT